MEKLPRYVIGAAGGKLFIVLGDVAAVRMAKKLAKSTCRAVWIYGRAGNYQKTVTPPRKCGRGNTGRIYPSGYARPRRRAG